MYLGDYQLQVSGRSEIVDFARSRGAFFEDRELIASLEQRESCLVGKLRGTTVAIAKRNSIDRLAKELELFRSLQDRNIRSPCIIDFIGAFIDRDGNFLVATKYCRLGDLYMALTKRKFPVRSSIAVIQQILTGISVLHSCGFVWRDCKPENILMLESETICIADFSLACSTDDVDLQTTRCGTLGYTAPEILLIPGGPGISEKCDLWSAGSVLFDLLVGNSLCSIFRVPDEQLKSLNRDIYCAWKGQGIVNFIYGERKIKIDFQLDLVAELISGLLTQNPSTRLSAPEALEISELILGRN